MSLTELTLDLSYRYYRMVHSLGKQMRNGDQLERWLSWE